jgi:hypothetical protein
MKRRNPRYACRRIAEQISFAFGIEIDKDIVRRVLAKHFRRNPSGGASWLTFFGHSKDGLCSLDLFRCESLFLRSHWVMVVMDQYGRRIVGFSTGPPFAACSVKPFQASRNCRPRSALITIPSSNSTDGRPICAY